MSPPSPLDILTALSDSARVGDAEHVAEILREFPTVAGVPTVAVGSARETRVGGGWDERLSLQALFPDKAAEVTELLSSLRTELGGGRSALHAAAANGHDKVVAVLRRAVASLSPGLTNDASSAKDPVPLPPSLSLSVWLRLLASPNDGGNTPLHWAALNNHGAIIHHSLTALGTPASSPSSPSTDESSPDVARLLAAVLNSRDSRGWTCADTAYHARHQELYEALLSLGVTPGGGTAIDSGAEKGEVREEVGEVDQADLDGLD
jgi:ankyrin repeat protein